ncbi:MAG TPA: NAD(P)-dependent oxidoreductase [Steroidobacteraceae bacterium]|nr:NAD(P)-dependent oxidoreductase [Steroidobacteraceae bacterium]
MTTKIVTVLGLGRMGSGIAQRLLESGYHLHVFNRTASRAAALAAAGARAFATPREACAGTSAILAFLSDDAASREVWLGPDGALAGASAPGAFALECSTLSHDWVLELGAESRRRGLRYIDAPVTGLPQSAAAGELTVLAGAAAEDLEDATPLLAAFSSRVIHFGPAGAGTAYKLLVNMLGAVQIASAAEVMALAEKAGLEPQVVADALASGQAASPQVIRNTRRMAAGDPEHPVIFTPQLRLKDAEYALALARKLGVGSPFGALAAATFRELCALGRGEINESAVIEIARSRRS